MEPRRKKTVLVMIDGAGPFQLDLEVEPFVQEDDLAGRLVAILTRTIQGRVHEITGIHWDQEQLRESGALIRLIAQRFNGAFGPPTRERSPRRRRVATVARTGRSSSAPPAPALPDPK